MPPNRVHQDIRIKPPSPPLGARIHDGVPLSGAVNAAEDVQWTKIRRLTVVCTRVVLQSSAAVLPTCSPAPNLQSQDDLKSGLVQPRLGPDFSAKWKHGTEWPVLLLLSAHCTGSFLHHLCSLPW